MRRFGLWLALAGVFAATPALAANGEAARWKAEAARVAIVRDDWGIAHVHGKTDADAVFGMIYAQAEDDFHRVEVNYLTALGRAGGGGGRDRDLPGPAGAALHRAGRPEGALRREPGLAEGADGRLGRRAELLSRDPPCGEAAR